MLKRVRQYRFQILLLIASFAVLALVPLLLSGESHKERASAVELNSPHRGPGLLGRPPHLFLELPVSTGGAEPLPQPKLTTVLADLSRATPQEQGEVPEGQRVAPPLDFAVERMPKSVLDAAHGRMMRVNDQAEVQVYILVNAITDDNRRTLRTAGARIELEDAGRGILQSRVPVTRLEMVAGFPFVRSVRLPSYAIHHTGSVTTEGDAILKADQVRGTLHVDGTGVKVGAVSDGLKGIFATGCTSCGGVVGGPISTGDLPSSTGTRNASGVLTAASGGISGRSFASNGDLEGLPPTPCGFPGAGAEGTAILEIIHDLAPGAQLSFANAETDLEFNQAVNFLAASNDIVMDDLGFIGLPYDGTSDVSKNTASALNGSANAIRAYFTSVGNDADGHYRGDYVDSGVDGTSIVGTAGRLHLFQSSATTTDLLALGASVTDKILMPPNSEAAIFLTWDDVFGKSNNDYNLFLVRESTGTVVAKSTNPQTGTQEPLEIIDYTNDTGAQDFFHIIIQNAGNRAAARMLNLFVFTPECAQAGISPVAPTSHSRHNYNTASNSVPAQSDAGGTPVSVSSVGAIRASDPGNVDIEFFSSNGPTLDGRIKPDVTAIDGVAITGAGSFENPFFGTSAAAPHAAGVGALLLEAAPCLRSGATGARDNVTARTTLRNLILNNAVDLGAPGPDNVFGYGRIDALASASKTLPALTASANQTVSGNTPTGASVPLSGIGFSDPDGCPLTFNWTGSCGAGSGSNFNCPFGASAVSVTATNNGVTTSPPANLQITVTNFALGVSPAQASVKAGQAVTYKVTVTPQLGAFSSAVTLGCSGLPALAACSFSTPSVAPGASPATANLTLSTAGAAGVLRFPFFAPRDGTPFRVVFELVCGLAIIGIGLNFARRGRSRRLGISLALALALLAGLVACGGGGGSAGTPPGTYNIKITGTSGSLQHSGSLSLAVQ